MHKKNPPQFLEKDFDFCCGLDETRTSFLRPIFYGSYSHTVVFNSPIKVPFTINKCVKSFKPCLVNILKLIRTPVIELVLRRNGWGGL